MAKKNIDVEDQILKEFGDVITDAEYIKQQRSEVIPVTPRIDLILGGGIPEGSMVLLSGPPASGKSSLSLQIAANAQKHKSKKHGYRTTYYFDIEGRIKERDIFGNKFLNLDPDKFKLIQSKPGNILTGDMFIDIGERLIHNKPGCVFIFDSFSTLCTKTRMESDIKERFRDDTSLLLSSFCKRISQVIAVNKCIVIGITHIIANTGYGMKSWTESGGNKIKYQADIRLRSTHFKPWTVGKDDKRIGQEIFWECEKSAISGPGQKTTSWLRYGYGIDQYQEIVDLAIDTGLIIQGGAGWYSLEIPSCKDIITKPKIQGKDNIRQYLQETPKVFDALNKELQSIYLA